MRVGDLIQYNCIDFRGASLIAIVLHLDIYGDTLHAFDQTGEFRWMVKSWCKVIK